MLEEERLKQMVILERDDYVQLQDDRIDIRPLSEQYSLTDLL